MAEDGFDGRYRELIEQAEQIRASPIEVTTAPDPRTFKTSKERRLDHNRVRVWIKEAAKAINEAFPKGHPVRDEWDLALIRVLGLHGPKHLPKLLAIFERAASQLGSAPGGTLRLRTIKDDELADLIMQALYETRDEGGGGQFNWIALTHGVENTQQIIRVGHRLKDLALIRDYLVATDGSAMGWITPHAVSLIERLNPGEGLMDHLHNKERAESKADVHVTQGNYIGGNVVNSPMVTGSSSVNQNAMAGSPNARQAITPVKGIWERIVRLVKTAWSFLTESRGAF